MLRAPRCMRELDRRYVAAEWELWTQLNREPKPGEIARYLGINEEDVLEMIRYRSDGTPLSVDVLRPFEHLSLSYTIDNQLERVAIEAGLARLTATEREILREIYEKDVPINEIADKLGYSRRHITRLHRSALDKMRAHARPITA